jgi:two-component system CheB/CheR fusion protein
MAETDADFERLLEHLRDSRGFDFTGYKRSGLVRRVAARMSQIGIASVSDYADHLEANPAEFTALFNTILINVTSFLRDPEAWEYLRAEVIPAILAAKPADAPVRVWSAGCSSGEEAYTVAMALADEMGVEEFRDRVKIYATDVDDEALSAGRLAAYGEAEVRDLPPDLLARYFERQGARYVFRKDLRRAVIFGRNDLVQDAPISRIDLLTCRNTLMYFNVETQARILNRLHFALLPSGALFLGKAEMLLSHSRLFTPIDLKHRIFRRATPAPGDREGDRAPGLTGFGHRIDGLDRLREASLLAAPAPQIVLNADGLLAMASRQADRLFGVSTRDVGRPFRDLELSFRPVELRGHIEQAQVERRTVRIRDVEWSRSPGEQVHWEVQITPLTDPGGALLGTSVVFLDITEARQLQLDLEQAHRQLEAAYEELQSTNEELETTNEELQSTVEELETTNEELQSTNEELETMNEELQCTNDELHKLNDELGERTEQLDEVSEFFEGVISGLRPGVAVLDADMRVLMWNRQAEELWGLRHDEAVGTHLLNLDIGLPLERLRPMFRDVLSEEGTWAESDVPAVNRRGRELVVRVVCSGFRLRNRERRGAILAMYENTGRSAVDGAPAGGEG